LCGQAAEYYGVDHGRLKYYKCPTCKYYQISDHAERKLKDSPPSWKESLSAKAQNTPEEHLMVLAMGPLSDASKDSKQELLSDYIHKSECSL
jgi:hypothetical protein